MSSLNQLKTATLTCNNMKKRVIRVVLKCGDAMNVIVRDGDIRDAIDNIEVKAYERFGGNVAGEIRERCEKNVEGWQNILDEELEIPDAESF